ncbi:hypothetical protein BDV18DRAFT_167320 [Aspergillus unguis]
MPFEFIDNNATISRTARRRIRTHAATGKNTNKALARPSKNNVLKKHDVTPFRTPETILARRERQIERPVSDGVLFPIPVPARSKGLVREALFFFSGIRYNVELDGAVDNPDVMGSVWIRFFFRDEAYFHCSVATSILCSRNLVSETTQGMYHIARTYRIVQERLMSREEATADMTIAILVAMSQYERLQGEYSRGYVHVQGLRRMIELRGGLAQFNSECSAVALKVLRADLEYALQLGGRMLFGLEGIDFLRLLKGVDINGCREQFSDARVDLSLRDSLRADLLATFVDMRSLAGMLNDAGAGQRRKIAAEDFHNTIVLLGYRVLDIGALDGKSAGNIPTPMSILEEASHLGLIAFLVTFLRGLDHRIADKPLLSRRLRIAVQGLLMSIESDNEDKIAKNVLLWTLFIGAVAVFKPSDDEWLIPTINRTMRILGLSSWENVKQSFAGFPWVNALHDRTGVVLCSTQKFLKLADSDQG